MSVGIRTLFPLLFLAGAPALAVVPEEAGEVVAPESSETQPTKSKPQLKGTAGMRWSQAPLPVPGIPLQVNTRQDLARFVHQQDPQRALAAALQFADKSTGRDRAAALMVVGFLLRSQQKAQLAAEYFTEVLVEDTPLHPYAAWFRAEQYLQAELPPEASEACEHYQLEHPMGRYFFACDALLARAYALQGRTTDALEAAALWDAEHEDAPVTEQTELALALWEAEHSPEAAITRARRLATYHRAPLTGRTAENLLAELQAKGYSRAVLPDSLASRKARAVSLRRSRRADDAWRAFQDLAGEAVDDPALQRWTDKEGPYFASVGHRWEELASLLAAKYAKEERSEDAWQLWRAQARSGDHAKAAETIKLGLKAHGKSRSWRRNPEDLARQFMLSKDYNAAVQAFDALAEKGGAKRQEHEFHAAFATLMSGEYTKALTRLTALIEADNTQLAEARYWRAKVHDQLGNIEAAAADREWLSQEEPESWYTLLLRQTDPQAPSILPFARDGQWPSLQVDPDFPEVSQNALAILQPSASLLPTANDVRPMAGGFAMMRWGAPPPEPAEAPPLTVTTTTPFNPRELPQWTLKGPFFDPDVAQGQFASFAETWGQSWPELIAIEDLVEVGLTDYAGQVMSAWYKDTLEEAKAGDSDALALQKSLEHRDWRTLFLYTSDHHHSSRFSFGLDKYVDTPEDQLHAQRLAMPIAYGPVVWEAAEAYNLDPYLVLALMRTESLYDPNAISHAGARGPMQIMPTTGHLLADLRDDLAFQSAHLHNPHLAIDYGMNYLSLLMERFDNNFPLAVASYNGGPHNVSSWLKGTGADMPIDEWVEHIPFRETRRYVRKVSARYGTYLGLYTDPGTAVILPTTPSGDHRDVVDF